MSTSTTPVTVDGLTVTQDNVQRAYIAYYGRPGEPDGVNFWTTAGTPQTSMASILGDFAKSTEFTALYGTTTNAQFVDAVYRNVFGRSADAAGLNFYTNALTSKITTKDRVVFEIVNGAQGTDKTIIDNKASFATLFTNELAKTPAAFINYQSPFTEAKTTLATINASTKASELSVLVGTTIGDVVKNQPGGTNQTFMLTASPADVDEGGIATFQLTLDKAPTSAVTVNYATAAGTASLNDFVSAAGTVTFAAGQKTAFVNIATVQDSAFEADETFTVDFSGSSLSGEVSATGTIKNDDVDTANLPQTFTLTTGLDVLNGLSGADSASGVLQGAGATGTTIQPGDVFRGGAGTDTLNISVAGNAGAAYTLSAVQTDSVERVTLSQFDTDGTNATTIAADLMTGLATVGFSASAAEGDTVFSGLKNLVGAEMRNGAADLTLTYNSSVVSGSADTQNLTVSGLTGGTFTANGAETISITSELAASKLTDATSSSLKTLSIAGSANLTITAALTAATIDASAATGITTVTIGAASTKFTGGSGNDVVDISTNLTSADTLAGGTGDDTLKISAAGTIDVGTSSAKEELFNVSGFEVIDIASTNDAATLNLDATSGVTTVAAAANVKSVTISTAPGTTTETISFVLNGTTYTTAAVGANTVDASGAVIAAAINAISGSPFSAVAGAGAATTDKVTITALTGEAIEIGTFAESVSTTSTYTVSAYNDLTVTNLGAGQVIDIYSADAVTASLKDASGTADVLGINLKTVSGDKGFNHTVGTITANNIETINLGATGMTDGKITTVAALTGNAIKTLNITGDSDVTISAFTSSTALTTIDGSTSSGDLNLAAAPAAKDQSIKTGSGNDTIEMGAFLTAADTIDGGGNNIPSGSTSTGSDKLTASGNIGTVTTPAALKIANVETIEVATGGAAATYIDAAGITGAKSMGFSATSGTVKVTNLAAGVSIGLGESTNSFDGTMDITLADATGAADSISFTTVSATTAAPTVALTIAAAVETVNIAATTESANVATATFTNTNNAAKNIVLTAGHANDTVALGTLNAATTNVDASKLAAKLTVTTAATGAVTVSANGAVANSITTGAGADTITLAGKLGTTVQTIAGGTGNDVLNVTADNAATDFTSVSAVETINITVGGNSQPGFNDGTKDDGLNTAKTVNILGGDSLSTFTIGTAGVIDAQTAAYTFDASSFAGTTDVTVAAAGLNSFLTIKGGASAKDVVRTTVNTTATKVASMSGFETLVLTSTDGTVGAAYDLTNVTGLTALEASFATAGAADTISVSNLAAGVSVKATGTNASDNLIVALASSSGTTDALTLELAGTTRLNFDAAGIETLNLKMTASSSALLDGVTATSGSSTAVNITGAGTVTLNSMSSSITSVVSTGTGAVTIAAADRTSAAMTITGGEGGDSIAMRNASDVLTGGLGTDNLVVSVNAILGGIEVNLGATDQVVSVNGAANSAVQTGFEQVDLSAFVGFGSVVTGSTGANIIIGTALADSLTPGNGADTVTGGAGNDVIDLTETTSAADTVLFSATAATDGTDTINNFNVAADIIKFTDGGATAIVGNATKGFAAGAGTALGLGAAALAAANVIVVTDTQTQTGAGIQALIATINGGAGSDIGDGVFIVSGATGGTTVNLWYDAAAASGDAVLIGVIDVSFANIATLTTANFVVA